MPGSTQRCITGAGDKADGDVDRCEGDDRCSSCGLDQGEAVTIPSLPDTGDRRGYEAACLASGANLARDRAAEPLRPDSPGDRRRDMPVDAVTIGYPIRAPPPSAGVPWRQEKSLIKAEEKFARVTVACIGEAAARRLLVAGDRISGSSRPTLNQTVLVRLPEQKHEGMDHDTIRKS